MSCSHQWLALKLLFYLSSWEYKVWVEGNGPHETSVSAQLPIAPPVPMHRPSALRWVSLYMFYCPVLGSWFYVGLGPGVRLAWVSGATPVDHACEAGRVWNALPPHLELHPP